MFPTVIEIQAYMRHFNRGGSEKCPMIDYCAFINALRVPLDGPRLDCVKEAFAKINSEPGAQCFTIAQAKAAFSYEEFNNWCDAIECGQTDDEIV